MAITFGHRRYRHGYCSKIRRENRRSLVLRKSKARKERTQKRIIPVPFCARIEGLEGRPAMSLAKIRGRRRDSSREGSSRLLWVLKLIN